MIWLALSILCSCTIYLIFKKASQQLSNMFPMVVLNYAVCCLLGGILAWHSQQFQLVNGKMLTATSLLGILFISSFYLVALTTKFHGISLTSMVTRISLVLPFVAFLIIDNESPTNLQIVGVALSVLAILISTASRKKSNENHKKWLPVIVFVAYGLVDILLKLARDTSSHAAEHILSWLIFTTAGIIGFAVLLVRKASIQKEHLFWGLILGLVNYGSIYFFLQALKHINLKPAVIFPLNGTAILVLSSLLSVVIFKEKINRQKLLGICLACVAIFLLYFRGNG